jgi:hypothetical protein
MLNFLISFRETEEVRLALITIGTIQVGIIHMEIRILLCLHMRIKFNRILDHIKMVVEDLSVVTFKTKDLTKRHLISIFKQAANFAPKCQILRIGA